MAQPFIGEVRMFGGSFAPSGWMICAGQLLPISENDTLFNLIGTTYGGDGQSTFALPDLRSRVPTHFGSGFVLAQTPTYTPYISGFAPNTALAATSVAPTGGSQPHENLQPYLGINFILSLYGLFPSPT